MTNKPSEEVKEFITEIVNMLSISAVVTAEETQGEDSQTRIKIGIETEEASPLIGHHGETLNSIQHLANTLIFQKYGPGYSVLVDIAGYREEKMTKLLEIAENAASKAKFLNKPVALYPMNSYERKAVHEKITQIEGVRSESEGVDEGRRVIIYPVA